MNIDISDIDSFGKTVYMENKGTMIQDFTTGSVSRQLLTFAAPLVMSGLLQTVYNMVDMIVVGKVLGDVGLSAVSIGGDVSAFMTFVSIGFSSAGQVIISRYIGKKEYEKIGPFVSTMFAFLFISAAVISVGCIFLREGILRLMNTPEASFSEALGYSTVCAIGLIFIYGYNAVSAILRGMGDSKHPFIFIGIAALINVALDIAFVYAFDMGALGAALATVISQAISFICCAVFLIKRREEFCLNVRARDFVRLNRAMLTELVKLGVPMAIKMASVQFSKLFVNAMINGYGVAVSAFAGIANKIASISNLISNSLNTAGSSIVGQNIAARKHRRVTQVVVRLFIITLTIAVILSCAIVLFPREIFSLFLKPGEEDALLVGLEYIPIAILIFFGSACRSPMNALINGSGNISLNFVTAILDGIVLRIGLALLFGGVLQMEYLGYWLGDALAGFTPFVVGVFFYFIGTWRKDKETNT